MIEKIDFDFIVKHIELLGFDTPESINSIIFVSERLLLTLQEACVRTEFPKEAYRHIELMIAYQYGLDEIDRLDRQAIDDNPASLSNAKAISVENTRVEFNSNADGGSAKSKWADLKNKIIDEYDNEIKIFINRYRKLVW